MLGRRGGVAPVAVSLEGILVVGFLQRVQIPAFTS
jgi:hypothetical protein